MTTIDLKTQIERSIMSFSQGNLRENGIRLLTSLGYSSDRQVTIEPNTFAGFVEIHPPLESINKKKALVDNWLSVDILFQLTGDDLKQMTQGRLIFDKNRIDNQIIESYLFLAIELNPEDYSRTRLADITREVNKFFAMSVMILFKYGEQLTLSIINRRMHKKDESRDVLEKVTLIKGISINNPIRAHVEILFDLSLPELEKSGEMHGFIELHKAWQKTLDISELNKRFYREIANWYFFAVEHVEFPKGTIEDRQTRNATNIIRLITRLIFVWFIKEKGLVPDALFNSAQLKEILNFNDPQNSTYYKAILQNLFFATLNTEMGSNRHFRGKNKNPNGLDAHYGISTVYRYEDFFKDPAKGLALFAGIPFLNGGLFECLDKRDEKILVDGFSDDPRNQPLVPDSLFFGDELTVDMSEVYGDKHHSKEKVRGLIRIFDSYKFTIEENTPLDEEIALDPELLGKVFENLLAAYNPETGTTARKQTGSFYTPREIVNYMVDESLIAYLENSLGGDELNTDEKPLLESKLRNLLAYNNEPHQFTAGEADQIISAIDKVKVLDPACGSGAFPMGVLHKLVFILNKLDPGNVRWKERQLSKATEIPDATVRDQVIEDIEKSFSDNELDYGRKLYLIENCIYGVDIQPIAVQIAKLRFFISLVVDQNTNRTKNNLGIRPLPNLETRFVAANSLLGIEKPKQLLLHNPEIDKKERILAEVRNSLFTARTPATKRKYREMDKQLRLEIASLLTDDGWSNKSAKQVSGWDPYDQNSTACFFDPEWMFGISDGFDIVISNPPYIQLQTMHEHADVLQESGYETFARTGDIYCLFYERGYRLLCNKGLLVFITSNKWMRAGYGEALRNFFAERTNPLRLIDFSGQKIFESATVDVNIMLFEKDINKHETKSCTITDLSSLKNLSVFIEQNQTINDFKTKQSWTILHDIEKRIKNKIEEVGVPLKDWDVSINRGILTGYNEAFIISGKRKDELIFEDQKSAEIIRPILRGRDIKRYGYQFADLYLICTFPSRKYDIEDFPAVKKHLLTFGFDRLEQSGKIYNVNGEKIIARKKTNNKWFETQDSISYWDDFSKQKIIYPNMTKYLPFYLDDNRFMTNQKCFIVTGEKLAFLTAFFNSSLFKYCFRDSFPELLGGTRELSKIFFENIPILSVDNQCSNKFEDLVNNIQNAKLLNHDTRKQELEIDNLIFDLYSLTSEEKALIGFIEIT